jgi:hypothetical protein
MGTMTLPPCVGLPLGLSTRLDKLEAAMRGRDGGDPPNGPWLVYRLCDWVEGCPVALEEWERESMPQWKAKTLDRLVAAGKIRDKDRERVRFIVRTIVHPPKRPDDPLPEKVVGRRNRSPTLTVPTLSL